MNKLISIILLLTIYIVFFVKLTFAQSKILINEFLIDPQPQSVEIFNSGTESANISDWVIDDSGGATFYTIPKDSFIFPNQCLVFSADFNLNKTSADTIKFINNSQQLIDSFSYKSSSGSGVSYYRFPDNDSNWTTGSASLGFYNQTSISCVLTTTPTPTLTPALTITPTIVPTVGSENPTPTIITPQSYDNIYISETMVNPPTGKNEWVEIYNNNDFPVSLNNWYIDDLENAGSSPKIFSINIDKKSFGIFTLTSSIFNNNGDSVRLLDFNKSLKDDFEYEKTEQGKTLGRTSLESDDFCFQEPSYNSVNNPCINPTLSPTIICITKTVVQISTSTIKVTPSIKAVLINQFIPSNLNEGGLIDMNSSGQVLGTSDELIINSLNNKSLINLLTILSTSYSLLTITSILFKMKLHYGKSQKFYSSSLHSS